ncbi:hypothetical protein [Niabella soli]|uniref:Uncharacterized protein n=1 Tax=Niabella soli DSM 19437 TaxID=929713 RepID=W0F6G6_9BACT|nr:hypothetical protein [Niabella soli]AHF17049.1 hypothetical protein NIASO_00895 [Niabella soli DSM 19437]
MKKTTKTFMLALAATVITGSAFAQVDTTKKDTSMPQTDTTTHPKKDKKKDKKAPPQAFAPTTKGSTYTLVAINKEVTANKIEEETEA